MRLWKTPERLRRISYYLFLTLPLAMIASLLSRRIAWWQWEPRTEWRTWAVLLLALSAIVLGILRAKRWAFYFSVAGLAALGITCLWYSIRQENVALGLFFVAYGIAAYAYLDRLWSSFQVPALSPGIEWYQTVPEPIPGLHLDWGDWKGLRMSRLDLEGGFILGNFPSGGEKNLPSEILFHYRGTKMSCHVRLLTALASKIDASWSGIGVEFKDTDRDTRKDLSDFIEVLRGEGHVST